MEDNKYLYEYDLVGNRTKRTDKSTNEVMEYQWDIRDRLTGVVIKDLSGAVIRSAQYVYDVYDQRIAKIVDADGDGALAPTTERFVYGSNQNIALAFDGAGNLSHRYLYGDGVDQIEADQQVVTGATLWALADHEGSVRDVVDSSGAVLNHVVYDAFGNLSSQSNASVVFKFGYTGRELDAESGLQYNRARYFDPAVGRFISEDRIGFGGGDTNLYRYVFNSPTNFVDGSGNEPDPASARATLYGLIYSYYRTDVGVPKYAVEALQYALDSASSASWGTNPDAGGNGQVKRVKIAPDRVYGIDSALSRDLANTARFSERISQDVGKSVYSIAQNLPSNTGKDYSFGSARGVFIDDFFKNKPLNRGIAVTLGNFTVNRYWADIHIERYSNSATFTGEVQGQIIDVYDFNKPTGSLTDPINFLTNNAYIAQIGGTLAVYKSIVNFKVPVQGEVRYPTFRRSACISDMINV